MSSELQFETPENIQLRYTPAGLGSRFVAWTIDSILVTILCIVISILLLVFGAASSTVFQKALEEWAKRDPSNDEGFGLYVVGIVILVWGLGSFIYFAASELLLRGQTFGKRRLNVRVVRVNGFSLDAGGIVLRNVFRVIDHLPILWIVPVVSSQSQRFGDMVAGTVVVEDKPVKMSAMRASIAGKSLADCKFHFGGAALTQARPQDVEAVEKLMERLPSLNRETGDFLLNTLTEPLARRLDVAPPDPQERARFLQEFLLAMYHRQTRGLG